VDGKEHEPMNLAQMNAVENLIQLGFSAREAEFLYLVGTHSGVFTMRQFRVYSDVKLGWATIALTRKLAQLNYATRIALNGRDHVYHLSNKTFYRAILTEDSRLRRGMSAGLMRQRLQYMDYIAQNPEANFLTTEGDKREVITLQFGIPEDLLPIQLYTSRTSSSTTTRYFPERFPLFIQETATAIQLGIVYGEDPANSFASFRKFVLANRVFLDQIPDLYFVYVSASARRRCLAMTLLSSLFGESHAVRNPDLLRYFTLLRKFDYNQQHTFTEDDLAFWKHAAKRYDQPKYEPLYAEFCGQISLPAVSSASPQRTFDCTTFIPTTTLLDGIGAE
jgi:hypothetical protein